MKSRAKAKAGKGGAKKKSGGNKSANGKKSAYGSADRSPRKFGVKEGGIKKRQWSSDNRRSSGSGDRDADPKENKSQSESIRAMKKRLRQKTAGVKKFGKDDAKRPVEKAKFGTKPLGESGSKDEKKRGKAKRASRNVDANRGDPGFEIVSSVGVEHSRQNFPRERENRVQADNEEKEEEDMGEKKWEAAFPSAASAGSLLLGEKAGKKVKKSGGFESFGESRIGF